jgi:hypothetical protein
MAVSNHNSAHHGSQREYFDRPFLVPRQGYAHGRENKLDTGVVYASKTPMRSLAHCQALLDAFTIIETEKNDIKSPKRGYGYKP